MRKRDRKALCHYIRWVADEMELRDWTFELMREPAPPDAWGRTVLTYGRKLAQIYVCEEFRTLAPEKQRQCIVHELVHAHLEGATNMVFNDLDRHLGAQSDEIFGAGFRRHIEYGVDGLADALAKHLPLIEWP